MYKYILLIFFIFIAAEVTWANTIPSEPDVKVPDTLQEQYDKFAAFLRNSFSKETLESYGKSLADIAQKMSETGQDLLNKAGKSFEQKA